MDGWRDGWMRLQRKGRALRGVNWRGGASYSPRAGIGKEVTGHLPLELT